jgi:hypothetical protein
MEENSKLLQLAVQYLAPVLLSAVATGLTFVLAKLGQYLSKKAEHSKWVLSMEQLALLAKLSVTEVEATLRPLVKEFAADGSITADEGKKLKAAAVAKLIELAKNQGFAEAQKLLEVVAPEVMALVSGFVEMSVTGMKASQAVVDSVGSTVNP